MKRIPLIVVLFSFFSFSLPIFSEAQEKSHDPRIEPVLQQARQMADQLAEKIGESFLRNWKRVVFRGR